MGRQKRLDELSKERIIGLLLLDKDMRPTIEMIAERFGVSRHTIHVVKKSIPYYVSQKDSDEINEINASWI